jgi:hypothetical protein
MDIPAGLRHGGDAVESLDQAGPAEVAVAQGRKAHGEFVAATGASGQGLKVLQEVDGLVVFGGFPGGDQPSTMANSPMYAA